LLAGGSTDPGGLAEQRLLAARSVVLAPLETVTASAAEILDITDSSARLNFVGTLPLACTVVFGKTPQFGHAAIDLSMNGGAIIEHNPLLLGLEPDTLYHYRLQGSGEDGTFYVSEVATFRSALAEAATAITGPTNLLAAPATIVRSVSSNFGNQPNSGTWGVESALDGNGRTAWSSAGDGDAAFVEFELAAPARITKIEFWTRTMSNDTAQIFRFQVVTDRGETLGPFGLPDASRAYSFEVDVVASRLRFQALESNGGNTGAVEIAAYGEPVANN
jgi:hypothetical protein